jgi:hypothetical protein
MFLIGSLSIRQIFDPPSVIEPVLENLRNCLYPLADSTSILETIVSPLSSKGRIGAREGLL